LTRQERPNVLLVVFDNLSEIDSRTMADKLPALTSLRSKSVAFSNAYACSPESGPAQASLFTGLDMAAHGVWTNGVELPQHEITLPECFFRAGYFSWLVGRRHLAGVSNWTTEHPRPYEYHQIDWAHGPLHRSRQNAYLNWLQKTAPEIYSKIFPHQANSDETEITSEQRAGINNLQVDLGFNTWVGEQVCKRLSESSNDQPFFGIASFVVGESMGAAPSGVAGAESINSQSLGQADAALQVILENHSTTGQAENTVLVLTATRGSLHENAAQPLPEAAIKVPVLVSVPGNSAKSIDAAVSTMDIAPTLNKIANVTSPHRIQGKSLLSANPRGWALSRLRNPDSSHYTALKTQRWKLVLRHGRKTTESTANYWLYDLQNDPGETNNLAQQSKHQTDLEYMLDLMIDARVALEDRTEPRIANF